MIISTYTGRLLDLEQLKVPDIDLVDIAHALSHLCRWTGHTRTFYSVAQHSVLVADRVWVRTGAPALALAGLLHDAAEAYLGDLASPVKHSAIAAGFRKLEHRVQTVIAARFGLPRELPLIVHEADGELLATEARDLMPSTLELPHLPPALAPRITPWGSVKAEREMLEAWERYGAAVAAGPVF